MNPNKKPVMDRLKKLLPGGVFAEIGVWDGDFSSAILSQTLCSKLYLVDPYKHFDDGEYPDSMNLLTQAEFDKKYELTRERLFPFEGRTSFLRMTSQEAASKFPNLFFDFVYIDGNHEYQAVLSDILAWFPKVKKGGLLAGDDVYSTNLQEHDEHGNVLRVWETDQDGNPKIYGLYGTYKALLDAKYQLGFDFVIEGNQFLIRC